MKTKLPRLFALCLNAAFLLVLPPNVVVAQETSDGSEPEPTEPPAPAAENETSDDAAVAAVIARARAYLGTEEALDAVHSLHLFATVTDDAGKTHKIEIIMQRPMQQMVTEATDEVSSVTVLDDYTGWRRIDPANAPGTGRLGLMTAQMVRLSRANVAQTLFYYDLDDLAQVGGKVALAGQEEIDGVLCDKVIFTHPGDIEFTRFFNATTGQLVFTRTNQGTEAREAGEQIVAGIRFPRELHTNTAEDHNTLTFDEIRVNEDFPAEMFKLPMPKFEFGPKPSEPTTTIEPPTVPEQPLERDLPPVEPAPAIPEPPRDMSVE